MKKLMTIILAAAIWLGAQTTLRVPTGAIAVHFGGRTSVAADTTVNILGYFPTIDGIGSNLFAGEPEARNAFFTFRSVPLKPTVTPTTRFLSFIGLAPAQGEGFYNVYFQSNPNRDFSRPDTFSEGQLVASFRARSASVNLMPHVSAVFNATLILDNSSDFNFRGRTFNLRNHVNTLTIQALTEPFPSFELGRDNVTLGFAGVGVAANSD